MPLRARSAKEEEGRAANFGSTLHLPDVFVKFCGVDGRICLAQFGFCVFLYPTKVCNEIPRGFKFLIIDVNENGFLLKLCLT